MNDIERNQKTMSLKFRLKKIVWSLKVRMIGIDLAQYRKLRNQQLSQRNHVETFDLTQPGVDVAAKEQFRSLTDSTRQSIVSDDAEKRRNVEELKALFEMHMRLREFQFQKRTQRWQFIFAAITALLTLCSIVVTALR